MLVGRVGGRVRPATEKHEAMNALQAESDRTLERVERLTEYRRLRAEALRAQRRVQGR